MQKNLNEVIVTIQTYTQAVRKTTEMITKNRCSPEVIADVSRALDKIENQPRYSTRWQESIHGKSSKIIA